MSQILRPIHVLTEKGGRPSDFISAPTFISYHPLVPYLHQAHSHCLMALFVLSPKLDIIVVQ